jgi:hypothetical protein
LVLLALAGVSFVVGMTGLKTLESLTEGAGTMTSTPRELP